MQQRINITQPSHRKSNNNDQYKFKNNHDEQTVINGIHKEGKFCCYLIHKMEPVPHKKKGSPTNNVARANNPRQIFQQHYSQVPQIKKIQKYFFQQHPENKLYQSSNLHSYKHSADIPQESSNKNIQLSQFATSLLFESKQSSLSQNGTKLPIRSCPQPQIHAELQKQLSSNPCKPLNLTFQDQIGQASLKLMKQLKETEERQLSQSLEELEWMRDIKHLIVSPRPVYDQLCAQQSSKQVYKRVSAIELIQNAVCQLKKNNLYALKNVWGKQLIHTIQFVLDNWQVYSWQLEQELISFAYLAEYRLQIFKLEKKPPTEKSNQKQNEPQQKQDKPQQKPTIFYSIYETIYPEMTRIVTKLRDILKLVPLESLKTKNNKGDYDKAINKLGIKKQQAFEKLIKFLSKLFNAQQVQASKFSDKIGQYLYSQITQRTSSNDTSDFHSLIKLLVPSFCVVQGQKNADNLKSTFINSTTQSLAYLQNIEDERIVEGSCIGCSTFFLKNANILDKTVNKIPVIVFSSVFHMKDSENQIKNTMCSLLNSGGGVIIFDCQAVDQKKTRVQGFNFTEKDKQQYEQRLVSYLQVFQPRNEVRKSIKISFVPVVDSISNNMKYSNYSGDQSLIKDNERFKLRQFIKGKYVMRVIVSPSSSTSIYFWRENNNRELQDRFVNYSCSTIKEGVESKIKLKNISKQIKRRIKLHHVPEDNTDKYLNIKPWSYFDHDCRPPQPGIPLNPSDKIERVLPDEMYNIYGYASMIIIKANLIPFIEKTFREHDIDCKIQVKFEQERFSSAKHTAMLYHNKKFQQILLMVKTNPKFYVNHKPLLMISITNYLKLNLRSQKKPYYENDFRNLSIWFKKAFPDESIKCFQFLTNNNEIEYYIQTASLESTLYCYYLLNHYEQKALFKNPLYLDKMDHSEKEKRFVLLYTSAKFQEQERKIIQQHQNQDDSNSDRRLDYINQHLVCTDNDRIPNDDTTNI